MYINKFNALSIRSNFQQFLTIIPLPHSLNTVPVKSPGMTATQGRRRIENIKRKYCETTPTLSIERASLYTESWEKTEGAGLSPSIRVSLAMKHVYEHMTHYIDSDDRIAGSWCEHFLGMPLDIERGVFNKVLETELDARSMLRFRITSTLESLKYLVRGGHLKEFIKNQRILRSAGPLPLSMGLKTMSRRKINPFKIDPQDKRHLKKTLLPYWKDRAVASKIEKALEQSDVVSKSMHNFLKGIPGNSSRQVQMISTCATIASIQGHVILDFNKVPEVGLARLRQEAVEQIEKHKAHLSQKEFDTLTSFAIALDGVMTFASRMAEKIHEELTQTKDTARQKQLAKMYETCRKVPLAPAETFEEAVQAIWTVKTAVELAHPVNLHCFGRLDQLLCPYYLNDLKLGRITRGDAIEILAELMLKTMSQNMRPETGILSSFYHRFLGSSPITIGGVNPDGTDATNEVSYLFIDAAAVAKSVTNLSVRIHPKTPDEFLLKIARTLRDGNSCISLYNDGINITSMTRRGFSLQDARDYAIMGCVELTCPGKTGGMSANALLLSRLLDMTLRNGDSKTLAVTVKNEGPKTGDPGTFETFDELLSAFAEQARVLIGKIVKASDLRDQFYEAHLPAPHISAFMQGTLESKKDVTAGGATYDLTGISIINSIANVTDSLYVIKKLVFEQRKYSISQILEAVDHNFAGYEALHKDILGVSGKWGNANEEADRLAHQIAKKLFSETNRHSSHKGGKVVPYVISMTSHTIDGRLSIASPDGRRAATPYAASCNPYNVDKSGVTSTLRSVASLPFADSSGCAVNIKFHPSAIGENTETRMKWVSLIRTYFELGGSQLQPTVASAEMLRAAQINPQDYKDLIIKVGGYSTYFVDLGIEIQNEIIQRTEHA